MTSENPFIPAPDFARLRIEYRQRSLSESDVDPDPVRQFLAWMNEAVAAKANEPNAFTLATSTRDGIPSVRVLLLKGVTDAGFVFFTNYLSRKGEELAANPHAAMAFWWPELERQVRVEGEVTQTSPAESDAYFNSRPPEARVGSAASPQSRPVASRDELESLERALWKAYPQGDVPRPAHWGGYCLNPRRLEFWQGRAGRLHDRIEYVRDRQSGWVRRRLAP
ncbi:MAG: pyridoxamine-phosphate oxidase [Phycisphaerales bacterium]|nr:pyridoxamine-phosphate oxidase [Phycisphaerales bacterium]